MIEKEKKIFRKMFIVTEYAALTPSPAVCFKSFNRIPQSKTMHIMPRGHIETDPSTSSYPKGPCLIRILAQW